MRLRTSDDRGAAAVEFAIVLPLLVLLVLGIIEFGRVLNHQISVTHQAREAVRVLAVGGEIDLGTGWSSQQCVNANTTARVEYAGNIALLTGLFTESVTVSAVAEMRCERRAVAG